MQKQARVVIIGGGVVGASTLYHLSELCCSDAIMLERSELTSGSTWHGAGKSKAQGLLKNIADDDSRWSVELLGHILPAERQKFPLFDMNANRMRS